MSRLRYIKVSLYRLRYTPKLVEMKRGFSSEKNVSKLTSGPSQTFGAISGPLQTLSAITGTSKYVWFVLGTHQYTLIVSGTVKYFAMVSGTLCTSPSHLSKAKAKH